jgi:hypothetical protein
VRPDRNATCGSAVTSGEVNTVAEIRPSTQSSVAIVAELSRFRTPSSIAVIRSEIQPPIS